MVVTAAMANGARIIAGPWITIPNNGANSSSRKPFSINAPNPKVKTKKGIAILVSKGQSIEFNKPMNSTKRSMSSNELSLIPNPKKPIR